MSGGPESIVASRAIWAREGETLDGKFRLGEILGKGGMGAVVAAHHLDLDEPVALKFLLLDVTTHPTAIERFLREARATAKLRSPHVTRVFDVGRTTAEQTPYIVMERLRGEDLWSRMRSRGQAKIAEAVQWMLDVCAPLEEAHAQGVIHRDLKPQNIFLARTDGGTIVKLLDFGISRATTSEDDLTRANEFLGTPHFMSPEQYVDPRSAGPASDIYSLGACLYCILTMRPPFLGGDLVAISDKVLRDPPPPIAQFRDDVPEALARIIERCLAKRPEDRYPTARALRDALAPFAAGPAAPTAHLDDDTILAMQEQTLGNDALAGAEAHLAECNDCRALVAAASPSVAASSESPSTLDVATHPRTVSAPSGVAAVPAGATKASAAGALAKVEALAAPTPGATKASAIDPLAKTELAMPAVASPTSLPEPDVGASIASAAPVASTSPAPVATRRTGPMYAAAAALLVLGIGAAAAIGSRHPRPDPAPAAPAPEPAPIATTAPQSEPAATIEIAEPPPAAPAKPAPHARPTRRRPKPGETKPTPGEIPDER